MRSEKLLRLVAAACLGCAIVLPMRASAALPWLTCIADGDLGYCVANVDSLQSAGVKNNGNTYDFYEEVKVELIYYDWGSSQGRVIARSDKFAKLDPDQVVSTNKVAHWYAGVYCVRFYSYTNGYWYDIKCVDTNGNGATTYMQDGQGQPGV